MVDIKAPKTRKAITVVVVLAILALVVFGVFVAVSRSSIPQFDDGSEYSVIILDKTSGGIYEWSYTVEDTTIADVTDKTSSIDYENPADDGGRPVEQFIIKGNKAGRTKITLRYGSFADGSVEEEHTYLIEVNEKLESRVTEQK